jgi:UDP-3-O-acyl-N-acetylglucosamine deacetylase
VDARIDGETFAREIAGARTFCLEEEIKPLRAAGLGKGADEHNTVVLKSGGASGVLRFPDEPGRHKILDFLGDIFFIGGSLTGRVECERSGHSLNRELVEVLAGRRPAC